jgi:protein gp37
MAADSKIEWCDHTFNPWIGCTKVSTVATGGGGCDGCYAEVSTPARVLRSKGQETWGTRAPRVRTSAANWALPKRWNAQAGAFSVQHGRRQRVFCASLADVFDNAVDPQWRNDLFDLISATPNLDWLLLTKRIGNVRGMLPTAWLEVGGWPDNVRIGATVCNQVEAERDIPKLLALGCPNFLSLEPLLSAIWLSKWLHPTCMLHGKLEDDGICDVCHARGMWDDYPPREGGSAPTLRAIDWVIVGGESGPKARPMHPDWAASLRNQCEAACVPFMFKQWGEWLPTQQADQAQHDASRDEVFVRLVDGRTHTYADDTPYEASDAQVLLVGKKATGRVLDGREWNEAPA